MENSLKKIYKNYRKFWILLDSSNANDASGIFKKTAELFVIIGQQRQTKKRLKLPDAFHLLVHGFQLILTLL